MSFIGIGSLASAQVTMSTTATGGGKSYLSIDSKAVVTNIDTLFARLDSLSNKVDALNWGDVLDNDATATQDLDLNGKNATGASRIEGDTIVSTVTTTDSLSVPGNATIDGELVVADTIRAAAPALFADSVFVGGPLVATSVNSSTLSTNSMLLYVQASEFMVIESGNSGTWGDIDILAPVGKITLDSDDLITLNSTGTTSGNSGVVINAERVSISNVLNINPQATAPVLPDDGDVWLEALSSTTANLKIYYDGIWHLIEAIPRLRRAEAATPGQSEKRLTRHFSFKVAPVGKDVHEVHSQFTHSSLKSYAFRTKRPRITILTCKGG